MDGSRDFGITSGFLIDIERKENVITPANIFKLGLKVWSTNVGT